MDSLLQIFIMTLSVVYRPRFGRPRNTEWRLVINNLSSRATWRDIKDYMRQAGEVTFADAHKQLGEGRGVVDFATYDDMKDAMKRLDGTELCGRRIRLSEV